MKMKETITSKLTVFLSLCKNHKVKTIYAFGSATNESFNEETSDIDLLIEIDSDYPIVRGENLMSIWDKLEGFFQRKLDLLTNASVKNPILKKSIENSKILIYDGKEQKMSF